MDNTAENLRFLLWKDHPSLSRARWPDQVASWAACGRERAEHLLRRGGPTSHELDQLVQVLHIEAEDLQYARLLKLRGTNILLENIKYLLDAQGRGGAARLAEALGVQASTVSQWGAGKHAPASRHLGQVCIFFQLDGPDHLTAAPLFLSLDPVTVQAKKDWIHERIDALQPHEAQELFPAFRRLLGDK